MVIKQHHIITAAIVLGISSWYAPKASAAPSGGPYGPLRQSYAVPENARQVFHVSPDGGESESGQDSGNPTSIESAVMRAQTGDVIILRGGTYRTGDLVFNQGITLQPYRDEQPILKGTRIATEWERLPGRLWRTKWATLFPLAPQPWYVKKNNLRTTPVYLFNNDMVFVDDRPLATKGYPAELDENSFCVDYEEGYVYIGIDPKGHTVEITAFDNALTRTTKEVHGRPADKAGPVIRGIVFTQYAYRAIEIEGYDPEKVSPEEEHGKDVVGTVLEHCTLSHCSRVGAYLRGDHMVIRHNLVADTGTEGLFILASNDVLIERNVVTRNNVEGIMGYFSTAIKIFNQCYRVTCNDNYVVDNRGDSSGIWYDVGNVDGVFINNWLERTDNGFFFEISKGVISAGNVFVNCNTGSKVLNSSGAKLYQNTYINSRASFERTTRGSGADHFGWHPQSGPAVDERHGHEFGNNLLVADMDFSSPLLEVKQAGALSGKLTESMFEYADRNSYVRGEAAGVLRDPAVPGGGDFFLLSWAPVEEGDGNRRFESLEHFLQMGTGFEEQSQSWSDYNGPLFHGKRLGNYAIVPAFADHIPADELPGNIKELLGISGHQKNVQGAFPVLSD